MKKRGMIFSIGLIMICCVACGNHQRVSLQEQLKIMAEICIETEKTEETAQIGDENEEQFPFVY